MGSLDATKAKSTSDVNNDKNAPLPGTYMVAIKEVELGTGKKGDKSFTQEIVKCQVAGGTTPGQAGCDITIFLKHDELKDDYTSKHTRFALATQLMFIGQKVDDPDFAFFESAVNRFMVVRTEEFTGGDGKKGVGVGGYGYDMWSIADPEVADVLRHMDGHVPTILKRMAAPQQAATQQAAQQSVQQNPAQPAMAAAGVANGSAAPADWDMV